MLRQYNLAQERNVKKIFPHASIRLFVVAAGLCVLFSTSGLSQSSAAGDIHRVDFRNFRYYPRCLNEKGRRRGVIKTINCSYKREGPEYDQEFRVHSVSYGDLNGDGMDEAVVLTNCSSHPHASVIAPYWEDVA